MKALALFLWMLFGHEAPEKGREAPEEDGATAKEKRVISGVPWPMVCHFIVRVIDGPADTAVVVSKRDCPY